MIAAGFMSFPSSTARHLVQSLTLAAFLAVPTAALAKGAASGEEKDPWVKELTAKDSVRDDNARDTVGTGEEDDGASFDPAAAAELKSATGARWTPEFGPDSDAKDDSTGAAHSMRAATRDAKYTVKAGETLRTIAYRYCTSPAAIAVVNGLAFDAQHEPILQPGTVISIPIQFRAPVGFREGEQLTSGPGVKSLKTDNTNWGRPQAVQLLRTAFREMNKRWPQKHPALVGALSRPGGGRLGHHKSHRSGQDVDIGYLVNAPNRDKWGVPGTEEIDWQRMWFVVDLLEKTGQVAAIYMAPVLQRKLYQYAASHGEPEARLQHIFQYGPKGSRGDTLIRFAAGHRDHFHVRFVTAQDFGGKDT